MQMDALQCRCADTLVRRVGHTARINLEGCRSATAALCEQPLDTKNTF